MAEIRVIARAVARKGKESQLRELLRGMLAPTRAESDVNCTNSTSQTRKAASISTRHGKARPPSISTQPLLTINTCSDLSEN